jgi:tyrosyl-tRNA synthetase
MSTDVIAVLQARGFIDAISAEEELREKVKTPRKVYCGFDPTSDSLHLGNFVAIMGLAWFQRFGHTPVAIVGGATGMIGDPSGKTAERSLLDEETIARNSVGIRKNLEAILDFRHPTCPAQILNNYDWFKRFSWIGFLRDVGKYFRMGPMLAKDSVKTRLQSDEGLSFTEFSYQLLQGYDFLYLYDHLGVDIQLGGSDQWGNITAGTDLIRKVRGAPAYGVTFPLLTRSDGQKFGKSEKGAIWLSPEKLSPYEFFQYLFRVADADVIRLLRMLTFMDLAEIQAIEAQMRQPDYVANTAQKRLATEVTRIVHGEEALKTALRVTEGIAPGSKTELDAATLEQLALDMPSVTLSLAEVQNAKLVDLLIKTGLQASKGQARRLLQNGGVYLNNRQVTEENYCLRPADLVDQRLILLSVGKKNKMIVRIQEATSAP